MKAVVLVGGFGTRLRPLTLSTPKQMLPVVGRPMIEHVVAGLARHGVDEVVLSLGYRPDAFTDAYPDGLCAGVRLRYAVEPEPLDTAGAIRFAALEAGLDETFVVVNGDVFTDLDVASVWDRHHEVGAAVTIALTPVDDPSRYGVVPTDDQGRVLGFVEKPPRDRAPTNWINAGTYVFEPAVCERIPAGRKVSVERETFPELVADGALWAVRSDAYWVDAGTPETYLQVQLDLVDGLRGGSPEAVAADARVAPDALVEHAVVMSGARIGAGARVVDSVISPHAVIGEGAVVERSIVGPRAQVGAGTSLTGLTIVGAGEDVAAGLALVGERVPEPA